jgi:hypothetical protein
MALGRPRAAQRAPSYAALIAMEATIVARESHSR